MIPNVHRHPEWKRLYDELATKLEPGQEWPYPTLQEFAGIDIRTTRGRKQFLRCRDEILVKIGWWLENVKGKGYRVIHPNEQPQAGLRRVQYGKRQIRKGGKINAHARIDLMGAEFARVSTDMQVRLAILESQVRSVIKEQRKDIGGAEQKRLPPPAAAFDQNKVQ